MPHQVIRPPIQFASNCAVAKGEVLGIYGAFWSRSVFSMKLSNCIIFSCKINSVSPIMSLLVRCLWSRNIHQN